MNVRFLIGFVAISMIVPVLTLSAQQNVDIEGLGFFKERSYETRLAFLQGVSSKEDAVLDAAFLEDSAFLLLQQMKRQGYLKPSLSGTFQVGGVEDAFVWEQNYSIQLTADYHADHAVFNLRPGKLYYYDSITVTGVSALDERSIKRFFIPDGALILTRTSRVFTESNFDRRISRLLATLREMGYRQASLISKDITLDDETGAVAAMVSIDSGVLHRVGVVTVEWVDGSGKVERTTTEESDALFTSEWELEQRQIIRNAAYQEGYANMEIARTVSERGKDGNGALVLDVHFKLNIKSAVTYTGVEFRGDSSTSPKVLERLIELSPGDPLNPLLASESRRRLMGLGIHRDISMSYEPESGAERKLVYELTPAPWQELDLLAGWGSYELARVGLNWSQKNLFGLAHRYELSAKKSFRSTNTEATYSVPQLFGSELKGYTTAEYNSREEVSFDRSEQSIAIGTSKRFTGSDIQLSLEYRYAREDADRSASSDFSSEDSATIGSFSAKLNLDRRDHFLAPTSGYTIYTEFAIASQFLGGSVGFQKLELGGSYHRALFDSTILHLGIRAGTIFANGDARNNIPFTERFFNGGENSVRGYLEGEASPLDSQGEQIGAESFALLNLEIEQRVFADFSIVGFYDVVGNSRDGDFNGNVDYLSSIGLGLRYQSVVGPIRLEYGYNLNPRPEDSAGALHFSIGFPF
ncbi:MAG: BamA/OMP85 family outer membrane protein [Opitutaceae bacterium]